MNRDSISLAAARTVMQLVKSKPALPGGDGQLQAQIQSAINRAITAAMMQAAIELEAAAREILSGIDLTQTDTPDTRGWWETSTGATFGHERLALLIEAIENIVPK